MNYGTTIPKGAPLNCPFFFPLSTGINKSKIRSCKNLFFFFFIILQPIYLWLLFCYVNVNIIAHDTAVNTTRHHFFQATGKHVTIQNTFNRVAPKSWYFHARQEKPKYVKYLQRRFLPSWTKKVPCMFSSCLCGFSPTCPPVSCLCASDCPVWPVINWVTCDNRVLRRCLDEHRGVRHLKKGLRIAPELYVSFKSFKINCITHCGPPAFTFINTLA